MLTNNPQIKRKKHYLHFQSFLAVILSFVLFISSVCIVYAEEENSDGEVTAVSDITESMNIQSAENTASNDFQESIDREFINDTGDDTTENPEPTDSYMIAGDENYDDIPSNEPADTSAEINSEEISEFAEELDTSESSGIGSGELSDEITEESVDTELEIGIPVQECRPEIDIDNDKLFESYIEKKILGINPSEELEETRVPGKTEEPGETNVLGKTEEHSLTAQSSISRLDERTRRVYYYLVPLIEEAAAGTRTSTIFDIPKSEECDKATFTPEELGVETIVSNGELNQKALDAACELIKKDLSALLHALLPALINTMPYELYWYDVVEETSLGYSISSIKYSLDMLQISGNMTFKFPVCKSYAADTYTLNTSKVDTAKNAAENAKMIVDECKNLSDVERIKAYRTWICSLVSYNSAAAQGGIAYGDPWQLIYVFDGDLSTNVVCEGYSKAFQYLCDLSEFSNITCIPVTGTVSDGTGEGSPHMWNVVKMPNGKNYLVDITNCDEGTVGADTLLFLAGYISGSYQNGYTVAAMSDLVYKYDSRTTDAYSESDLSLNQERYPIFSIAISDATVTIPNATYNGKSLTPTVTVKTGSTTLRKDVDYKVTYTNNVNAGTGTATITGIGNYYGSKSIKFTIAKAVQTINASNKNVYRSKTVSLGATASGKGKLTYKSNNTKIAKVTSTGKVTGIAVGKAVVTITAAATANYKAATKKVTINVVKAAQTINASNKNVCRSKTVSLGATASGKGKLTYKSNNTKIAKVDSAGKVTGIAVGKAVITITAAATANYKAATKKVTVTVKNANTLAVSAKKTTVTAGYTSLTKGNVTLASNCKVSNAKGTVTYANASTDATAKKFKVTASTGSVTIPKGTKKGTYKVIIKVSAAGNDTYFPTYKSVTYSIKVS